MISTNNSSNNNNNNPNNNNTNNRNTYKQIVDKEKGIIYYQDERGDTWNPIELKDIEESVEEETSYYLSRLTTIWANKKDQFQEGEEREKWGKAVEEQKDYIRTTFAQWLRASYIHCENPNPPEGFNPDDGRPLYKVSEVGTNIDYSLHSSLFPPFL